MCIVCAGGAGSDPAGAPAAAAPPTFTLEQVIAQLDRNNRGWADGEVTYSFFQSVGAGNENDENYTGFQVFNAEQIAATRLIFQLIGDVADITFVEAADNGSSENRLTFANSSTMPDYVWGWASSYDHDMGGAARDRIGAAEIWVNSDGGLGSYALGTYNFHALLHEVLHGLGIPHPGDYNANADEDITYGVHAEYAQDSRQYTVMTYFASTNTGAKLDSFGAMPLLHDIAILQHIYGANMSTRTGDTTYGFNSNAGRDIYDFSKNTGTTVLSIWDAGGIDTIDLSGFSDGVTIDLREGGFSSFNGQKFNMSIAYGAVIENVVGTSAGEEIFGNAADNRIDGGAGADAMIGGRGDDTYIVDNPDDAVFEEAGEGFDVVYSTVSIRNAFGAIEQLVLLGSDDLEAGNVDRIVGNSGDNFIFNARIMEGGAGDDLYDYGATVEAVIERAGEGYDIVQASVDYDAAGQSIEEIRLVHTASSAWGNELDNVLIGQAGDNVLDGRGGADRMAGGLGDDTYYIDVRADEVVETAGEGYDRVFASVNYTLAGTNAERLTLTGGVAVYAIGNGLSNALVGNATANVLDGGGGADDMAGGLGNDTYVVDHAGDRVFETIGQGRDTVKASVSYSLAGQYIEALVLTGSANIDATGNSLNNTLFGNAGTNILTGGTGNDSYYVQTTADRVVEAKNQGADTVFSTANYNLSGTYVEGLTLTGTAVWAIGNSLNNILVGNAADNRMSGGGGYDAITGGLGADRMTGGDKSDRFIFTRVEDSTVAASDRITDLSAEDRIDLRQIDADTTRVGDQAFALVDALSGVAGQAALVWDADARQTSLLLDVNGDGQADARVLLDGDHRAHTAFLL